MNNCRDRMQLKTFFAGKPTQLKLTAITFVAGQGSNIELSVFTYKVLSQENLS